jgi:hypothetical protein
MVDYFDFFQSNLLFRFYLDKNMTNGTESAVTTSPDDIMLEERMNGTIESEHNIPLATTDNEHSKSLSQNNSEEALTSTDETPT